MGITVLKVDVANVANTENVRTPEFIVDTGAVYSIVPTSVLGELGIKAITEQDFRLADGRKIRRKRGGAFFRYRVCVGVADVIFGENGDQNLLGALTLEAMGVFIDPLKRELIPLPMILA